MRKRHEEMRHRGMPTRGPSPFRLWRRWNTTLLWALPFSFSFIILLTLPLLCIWFKNHIPLKIQLSYLKMERLFRQSKEKAGEPFKVSNACPIRARWRPCRLYSLGNVDADRIPADGYVE